MAYNYQPYKASSDTLRYKDRQDVATNTYNAYANKGYSAGAGGLGSEVNTARDRLNALYRGNTLSQQFKYNNQKGYNKALNDIQNREAFKYDLSDDNLFQQAKQQYQAMGKTAMADTIGQASSMTGGYGNSYATTAGNQAYNAYLQELNNSVGDYYAMAMSAYNNETDRLNGVFNAVSSDRATQQAEWAGNWNVYNQLYNQYYNQYSDMLNKDQSAWEAKGNNLYNSANLATGQYSTASSNDINIWNSQEQLRAEQAQQIETERANRAEEAYRQASLAETIRANKANENYNKIKMEKEQKESDDWYDPEADPIRTDSTVQLIKEIDRQIQNNRYKSYSGDYEKTKKNIAPSIIDKNRSYLSSGEINYLLDYYHI